MLLKIFLSCLCGSDHTEGKGTGAVQFLSCLCGSDLATAGEAAAEFFLSCLCGSDHRQGSSTEWSWFSKLPMRQ